MILETEPSVCHFAQNSLDLNQNGGISSCPGPLQPELAPYRLSLEQPWPRSGTLARERRGWILTLRADGVTGRGECAPLPAAGTECEAEAHAALQGLCRRRSWPPAALAARREELVHRNPAVACALETALLDLQARVQGVPLRRLLLPTAADGFEVNAVGGTDDPDCLRGLLEEGFRIIKIKVGERPPEREIANLQALARRLPPGVSLRLDANGAWRPETARRFLEGIAGLPIDCLEEPLARPEPGELRHLQQATAIPLALDESLKRLPSLLDFRCFPLQRVILKPMVQGGPRTTLELARRALAAGVTPVITSTLESSIGLHAAAQVAAALEALRPGIAHGLATGRWLRDDTGPPLEIRRARVFLNQDPGLGLSA